MDTIQVNVRDFSVKAKRLRAQGIIPGSVFGGPLTEAISLQLRESDVEKLLARKSVGSRLTLELDGKNIPVQLKEIDKDPLQNKVQQISFQALKADQKVNSVVHIVLKNTEQITSAVLEQLLTEVPYSALPHDMIDTVTIDVAGMQTGTVVKLSDIAELNSGRLELQTAEDEIVFRIVDKVRESAEEETEPAGAAE